MSVAHVIDTPAVSSQLKIEENLSKGSWVMIEHTTNKLYYFIYIIEILNSVRMLVCPIIIHKPLTDLPQICNEEQIRTADM